VTLDERTGSKRKFDAQERYATHDNIFEEGVCTCRRISKSNMDGYESVYTQVNTVSKL
jgi:hypothetical protein